MEEIIYSPWRADTNELFYWVDECLVVRESAEGSLYQSTKLYVAGNYFKTYAEAANAAEGIRLMLHGAQVS